MKLAPLKVFSPARDNALAPSGLSGDQAHVTSELARDPTESDSDDDAVVIGRSVKNKKEMSSNQLNSETSEERNKKESKKPRETKKAKKESAKKEAKEEKSLIDEEGMFTSGGQMTEHTCCFSSLLSANVVK